MDIKEKISLVTGGTHGIGAATVRALAENGSDISIIHRTESRDANALQSEIEKLGRRCLMNIGDLSDPEVARKVVENTYKSFGSIDILVHAAGMAVPGSLLLVSIDDWYKAFDIHVHAIFHLCRSVVPIMQKVKEGAIILISSVAGIRGCAGSIAYGVAKGAVQQFTRSMARELANDNIRVNCVSPGIIRTRLQDYLTQKQVKNNIENRIPLHREGKPEDVAELILMLITNQFITGENVTIDGGMTMRIV